MIRPGLTHLEVSMLAFEHRRWNHRGAREQAITDLFGITPVRYAQALNQLLDHPDAYVLDPVLVKRLRAIRDGGRAARSA